MAGKRLGFDDNRSVLFLDAARIIKEMRVATNGMYPTFAVWENVPGAFSSNGGEDFRAVLEELARVEQPDVSIPRPSGRGGRWSKAGAIAGSGWSLAWRQLDVNIGESPNAVKESLLSQILEDNVPQKFYLSARACQRILVRASRRGKPLPELLKQALLDMIEWWNPGTLSQVVQKVKEQEGLEEKELDEYWSQTIERLRLDAQNLQPTP